MSGERTYNFIGTLAERFLLDLAAKVRAGEKPAHVLVLEGVRYLARQGQGMYAGVIAYGQEHNFDIADLDDHRAALRELELMLAGLIEPDRS